MCKYIKNPFAVKSGSLIDRAYCMMSKMDPEEEKERVVETPRLLFILLRLLLNVLVSFRHTNGVHQL